MLERMESVSAISNERRYVMHTSSPEGYKHMVSSLTTENIKGDSGKIVFRSREN